MNSKNIIVVIGILAAVALGIYIIPKTKSLTNGSVDSGGIVTFMPNPSQYNILAPKTTTVPTTPSTTSMTTTPKTAPVVVKTKPAAPKPAVVTASAPVTSGTYYAPSVGLQFTVPNSWRVTTETVNEDNILFYGSNGTTLNGLIEILVDADQSYNSLMLQLSADSSVSNIHEYMINGEPVASYQSLKYGNQNIAVVVGNTIYYFHGGVTAPEIMNSVRFSTPTSY
jgi:hypothetical protein